MAKPTWLTINPDSGSGNGSISNSASEHTGRVNRTGIVTVTAVNKGGSSTAPSKTYSVNPKLQKLNLWLLMVYTRFQLQ